jgi:transposase
MFDGNDGARRDRLVAVTTGSVGRRRWSAEDKAAVIRETLVPGTRISDVARRWQMDPQQVYRWRHSEGVTARGSAQRRVAAAPAFVPIITDAVPAEAAAPAASAAAVIEISLAGAVVRVASDVDNATQLTVVLRAVRASALRR